MSVQLQFDQKDNWVVARLNGVADIDQVPQRYEQIADHCQRMNMKRLLVDVTKALLPLSTTDKFEMGHHAIVFAQRKIKVAVLMTPDQIDPHRFGELVAKNRGVNIQVFTDKGAAEAWLLTE